MVWGKNETHCYTAKPFFTVLMSVLSKVVHHKDDVLPAAVIPHTVTEIISPDARTNIKHPIIMSMIFVDVAPLKKRMRKQNECVLGEQSESSNGIELQFGFHDISVEIGLRVLCPTYRQHHNYVRVLSEVLLGIDE